MEMQRVWAVYFSGTGTTEKVVTRMAKIAAEDLGAEYKTFCFNLPKDREGELSFGPGDLVIFGTPVYAGRVPNLLLPCEENSLMYESLAVLSWGSTLSPGPWGRAGPTPRIWHW